MEITLTHEEIKTIDNYRRHLWKVGNIGGTLRETLSRIIFDNSEELKMVEGDLFNERKK